MKETEEKSTNPAASSGTISEDDQEKRFDTGTSSTNRILVVDEKRLAQGRIAEKTCDNKTTSPLGANERANIMLDYLDKEMEDVEEMQQEQERKKFLAKERERIASRKAWGNKPNPASPTNQEQTQDGANDNGEKAASKGNDSSQHKDVAGEKKTEKMRVVEGNTEASLRANRNAKIMLDYIDRGETGNVGPSEDPGAFSTNHDAGSSSDRLQDNSTQSMPGSVRVPGIDMEREGSILILSDPPESPAAAGAADRDDNSDVMVHARVVDDENIEDSKVLATAKPDPWWRRHQWWLAAGAAVLIGAIATTVILTTVEFGTPTTESPSMAPTTYPEGVEDRTVQLIESVLPANATARLSDMSSPQYSALHWLIAQRLQDEETYRDSMVVLRHYSLAVLFFETGGASSWSNTDGWLNSTSVCDWYGVQCSLEENDDDAVMGLNLTSNGLNGTISPDIAILAAQLRLLDFADNDLFGTIPEQIGSMTALTHLSLAENDLSGSFPPSFGIMTNLMTLDLSANSLDATLPTELGLLTSLEELRLSENDFNGEIPSEVGQLTALENVGIAENRLSYALPSEFGRLNRLQSIDAHGNALLGPLPTEIGLLESLRQLDVSDNFIFDKISPERWSSLTSLTSLDLSHNLLTGTLPHDFGYMKQLSSLSLNGNFLEGIIDFEFLYKNHQADGKLLDGSFASSVIDIELPSDLPVSHDLVELDLSSNFFTGTMPPFILSFQSLLSLNVSSNRLTGSMVPEDLRGSNLTVLDASSNREGLDTIPETIGTLSNLKILKVRSDREGSGGSLPAEIAFLSNLITLDVNVDWCYPIPSGLWSVASLESLSVICNREVSTCDPSLFGQIIPSEVGTLTHLQKLRITDCEGVVGSIPSEVGLATGLTSLDLAPVHSMWGPLPSELGQLSLLTLLSVGSHSGTLPTEVGMLEKIKTLNLEGNYLRGSIPTELGMLTEVDSLRMEGNSFDGTLPSEIGMMTNLLVLDIGKSALSGDIPTEFGMLTNLNVLDLWLNALSGPLPTQLGMLSKLNTLKLEVNALQGQLPSEIGLLQDLVRLSVGENVLNGTIPPEIGHLTSLTQLLMQANSLNGELPSEIGLMTLLEALEVSDNFLTGTFPAEIGRLPTLGTLDLSNNLLSGLFPQDVVVDSGVWDMSETDISGSVPDEICEQLDVLYVDCARVACNCCSCPSQSPTLQPSQSAVPTNLPQTSAPSGSLIPTKTPSLSFQPSLTSVPSSEPQCSPFSSIGSIGFRLDASDQDDGFGLMALQFEFPGLGGIMFVTVTSNGVIFPDFSFETGCCSAFPIEGGGSCPISRIAVAHMDLSPQNGNGSIYSWADEETLVISWEDVPQNGGNDGFNFQALLYANGNVEIRWGEGAALLSDMASGILDDSANISAPVTGPPFDSTDLPGITREWPQNQCRLFTPNLDDGGYDQVAASRSSSSG